MRTALAALLLTAAPALADPVQVTIRPVPDFAGLPFQWEAYPLDLPDEQVEAAIAASGQPLTGDWTVALEPGLWQVSGFGEAGVLTATITVADPGAVFEIAAEEPIPPPPFACPDLAEGCLFSDPATLVEFRLPQGWAADQPFLTPGAPVADPPVGIVFFQDMAGEGGEAWFLNPAQWSSELGPCQETALGPICTFALNEVSQAAVEVIGPSLRRITAEEAAQP